MILYKAIKYKILENCLEVFINGFIKNFSKVKPIRLCDLRTGTKLSEINRYEIKFYDCEIITAEEIGEGEYYLIFKFMKCNDLSVSSYAVETANGELVIDYTCNDEDWNYIL